MRFFLVLAALLFSFSTFNALADDCLPGDERVSIEGPEDPTNPSEESTTTTERCYCGDWYVVSIVKARYLGCEDDPFSNELVEDAEVTTYDYDEFNNVCTWGGSLACVVLEKLEKTVTKSKLYFEYYSPCSARSPRKKDMCPMVTHTDTTTHNYSIQQYGYTYYWLSSLTTESEWTIYRPTYCDQLVSGWTPEDGESSNTQNFPPPINLPFCPPLA